MKVRFVNSNDIDTEIKVAGWMASASYDSKTEYATIGKKCINSGHGVPTRPMRFMFEISEVSRAFSHEFVRHEIGVAKVQRSQRFVNEDGFRYVTPKGIMDLSVQVRIPIIGDDQYFNQYGESVDYVYTWLAFSNFQDIVKQMYKGFIEQGAKPEDARYCLSNATFTKINVSFDWEGLQQFCLRRCCTRAQWEIRELAMMIIAEIRKVSPFLADKLGAHCHVHGYCPEEKGCGRAPSKEELCRFYQLGKERHDNR